MSATLYLLVPHAPGSTCADLIRWPDHWPRGRGAASYAELEPGMRFSQALAGCQVTDEEAAMVTRLCALEPHRGVRTRLDLPRLLAALERAQEQRPHPRLRVTCEWLRAHRDCASEVIVDVHCNTSGIYDDDFRP
jgi:hypothetical protein